jgi:cell division protein FtsB
LLKKENDALSKEVKQLKDVKMIEEKENFES